MYPSAWRVAPLLFGSGLCALVYQIAWQREFRLIFGASTAASAAVLAIFIGGLGVGGLLLGARADRHPRPLELYARLEAFIAASAAVTPLLLEAVRAVYIRLGGSVVLGLGGGTALRLVLAAAVLLVPTVLMGGTLPAAARGVAPDADAGRRSVALLYGINTLGAVTGSGLATFWMLELFGTRQTLWIACLLNLLVAVGARSGARAAGLEAAPSVGTQGSPATEHEPGPAAAPAWFALTAAAVVGFAFFLMEMVWYRMLGPLLGGTIFTFGLILGVALLGIGLGGLAYSLFGADRPATIGAFAWTCLLEAACVAFPFALGDQVALAALLTRPLGVLGFYGHLLSWGGVTLLVVLPAAFVAGVQFPLLIALLGQGRRDVGRQIGLAYAWNTVGAITGSLAGGFGLLPALTATGCWQLVAWLLAALGLGAIGLSAARERQWRRLVLPGATIAGVLALLTAPGPSAVWRHSPIGSGKVDPRHTVSRNALRAWSNSQRRGIVWQAEGVESSVALDARTGLAFVVNGKVDGNAIKDAPTQVMGGMVGAILHPAPKRAMVIGLGTGSSAGWLGAIPGMETVDAVELEPAILEVARRCAPVNQDVLNNPKVHLQIGDAREVLLTSPGRYDLIFSEPSNPYRAGIASLFTREYYDAVAARLEPGGLFLQWVQAYDVDSQTVRTIYATLAAVFPNVETWQLMDGDLLLVGSMQPGVYDAEALRRRISEEPFKGALTHAWRATELEDFLGRYVAGPELARAVSQVEAGLLNTDDRSYVEFGFARAMGRGSVFDIRKVREAAVRLEVGRPAVRGAVDWERVREARAVIYLSGGGTAPAEPGLTPEATARIKAQAAYLDDDLVGALATWRGQPAEPRAPLELAVVADALAEAGDEAAVPYVEALRGLEPVEADAILARLRLKQGRYPEAMTALEASLTSYRSDPWAWPFVMWRALETAEDLAAAAPPLRSKLYALVREPFSVLALNERRQDAQVAIASRLEPGRSCLEAFTGLEPDVPWRQEFLLARLKCFVGIQYGGIDDAAAELAEFRQGEVEPLLSLAPGPAGRGAKAGRSGAKDASGSPVQEAAPAGAPVTAP